MRWSDPLTNPMPTASRRQSAREDPRTSRSCATLPTVFQSMTATVVSFAPTTSDLSPENPLTTKPSSVPSCVPSSAERIVAFHGPPAPPVRALSASIDPSALAATHPKSAMGPL